MGRDKADRYRKTLHQQVYERLTSMQAFGESKLEAKRDGTMKNKIFSYDTYQTYKKHIGYFIHWLKEAHPDVTTLKAAKRYVNEWLTLRSEQTDKNGKYLSAWTIQTEAAALNKLFQIDKADPGRFEPPRRAREDIKRSRVETKRDKHFSVTNNDQLIRFCKGTGCRRNVLEKLEGRDFWSRERMEAQVKRLDGKGFLSKEETRLAITLKDALDTFPEEDFFLHHRKDKNGKFRFAPIVGPDKAMIIERMRETPANEKVWLHVHKSADIHGYRADYANRVYKKYARPIDKIPYDRVHKGTVYRYQSEVYFCRNDERGKKLDRVAMVKCSKSLGHNRVSVVAASYLRGL